MIKKIVSGCIIAGKIIVFLFALSVVVLGAFVLFYVGFHSQLETKYRTVQVIKFEDTLKIKNGIPFYDDFIRISEAPYSLNNYDCSNKCVDYIKILEKAGLKCKVILTQQGQIGHALVWVEHFGFYDPTNKSYTNIPGTKDPLREFLVNNWLTYSYGYFYKAISLKDAMNEYPEEFK